MITQNEFFLSGEGLKNAAFNASVLGIEPDFEFVVGDKKYPCSSFAAEFLSPAIAEIRSKDPSVKSFKIDVEDPNNYFDLVLQLMNGFEVEADIPQSIFLTKVGRILQNDEIVDSFSFINNNRLTIKNVIPTYLEKKEFNCNTIKELEYITKHFYAIDEDELLLLDKDTLMQILSSDNLIINFEDSLYLFVSKLIDQRGSEYNEFLKFVRFENVSIKAAQTFNKYLTIDIVRKSPSILQSLQKRMLFPIESIDFDNKRYIFTEIEIPYQDETFNGIFSFLTEVFDGNPVDQKVVDVTVLKQDSSTSPSMLLEYKQPPSRWCLKEVENNWLCFDFKEASVAINAYSIASGADSSYWEYPVSFTWEGSMDQRIWTEIDVKDENTDMGGNEKEHTWILKNTSPFFRYIRFRLRNVTRSGGLYTTRIEFFGYIKPPKQLKQKYESVLKTKLSEKNIKDSPK